MGAVERQGSGPARIAWPRGAVGRAEGGSQAPGRSGVDGMHLRPGRPLLAASARPWAGALLASCAIVVAVPGVLFARQANADWLDHAVDSPIVAWLGGHGGLALRLAAPGSLIPAGVLSAAIVIACSPASLTAPCSPRLPFRLPSDWTKACSSPWSTAPIWASSAIRAGMPRPCSRLPPRSRCCSSSRRTRLTQERCAYSSRQHHACWEASSLLPSSACDGTTSPIPWPAPPSASERSAGSRSFWTCQPPDGGLPGRAASAPMRWLALETAVCEWAGAVASRARAHRPMCVFVIEVN
jgi:hypothetical protein